MRIQKAPHGQLEGTVYRGNQIINQFVLDFINESIAVSRNVYMPAYIKFRLTPAGGVTTVYFNNIEFSKRKKDNNKLFKEVKAANGQIGFTIPAKWTCNFKGSDFSASAEKSYVIH